VDAADGWLMLLLANAAFVVHRFHDLQAVTARPALRESDELLAAVAAACRVDSATTFLPRSDDPVVAYRHRSSPCPASGAAARSDSRRRCAALGVRPDVRRRRRRCGAARDACVHGRRRLRAVAARQLRESLRRGGPHRSPSVTACVRSKAAAMAI